MRRLTLTFKTELWVNSSLCRDAHWVTRTLFTECIANKCKRETEFDLPTFLPSLIFSFTCSALVKIPVLLHCGNIPTTLSSYPKLHRFDSSAWKLFVFSSISWEALMVFASLTSDPWFGAEVGLCCVWMAENVRKHKHRSHYMDSGGEHCRVCVINSTEKHHLLFGATWSPFPRFES